MSSFVELRGVDRGGGGAVAPQWKHIVLLPNNFDNLKKKKKNHNYVMQE